MTFRLTSSVIIHTVRSYTTYRNKRAAVKKQQRVELEAMTNDELVVFGKAAYEAREAGFKIEEILEALGQKNRNLLYAAIKAYKAAVVEAEKGDDDTPKQPFDPVPRSSVNVEFISPQKAKILFADGDVATVTFDSRGRVLDLPEKYLRDLTSDVKEQVKEALKLIQERFGS